VPAADTTHGRRGRLRVGLPAALRALGPASGHGRVWSGVLPALSRHVRLLERRIEGERPTRPGPFRRQPEVWLGDGHAGALAVEEPVVLQVHEIGWQDPELRAVLHPDFARAIEEATASAVRAAARVIVPSMASREQVIAGCDIAPEHVHAVPHGVDSQRFRPGLAGGREMVARALGGRVAPYVLFASQLHPRKNLDALRTAIAALAARGFPHVLAIVGGPAQDRPDPDALVAAAVAELPGAPGRVVRLTAEADAELAALMAGADAFCLPSLHEGFGLTVLEAMACGSAVIASDRGALPDLIGDAGVLVEPSAAAVEAALGRVLADPADARRLGEAARARALELTWERTARGWASVLEQAARGG